MIRLITSCGPAGWALTAVSVAALFFLGRAVLQRRDRSSRGILIFWGILGATFGFLGQTTGIYNSLTVIVDAESISPDLIRAGLNETFIPSVWGFSILVICTAAWLILHLMTVKKGKETGCELS